MTTQPRRKENRLGSSLPTLLGSRATMLESATPLPERLMARYRLVEELGGDRLAEAHLAKSLGVEGFEKTMVARVLAEPWR